MFKTSTHTRWIVENEEELKKAFANNKDLDVFTYEEKCSLLSVYSGMIITLGSDKEESIPIEVVMTAMTYFWRFYSKSSIIDEKPIVILTACLIIAAKVVEIPYQAENSMDRRGFVVSDIVGGSGLNEKEVLAKEIPILDVIKFHLLIYLPIDPAYELITQFSLIYGKYFKKGNEMDEDKENGEKENDGLISLSEFKKVISDYCLAPFLTDLHMRFSPSEMAIAAICLSIRCMMKDASEMEKDFNEFLINHVLSQQQSSQDNEKSNISKLFERVKQVEDIITKQTSREIGEDGKATVSPTPVAEIAESAKSKYKLYVKGDKKSKKKSKKGKEDDVKMEE